MKPQIIKCLKKLKATIEDLAKGASYALNH